MRFRSARVVDPSTGTDDVRDFGDLGDPEELDGTGLIICPGLVDLHAHLREPGFEESETIASGSYAALRGGFTTLCCMPNTEPALDTPAALEYVAQRSRLARAARVLPIAAVTRGRLGSEICDLRALANAGAVAFSDDGAPVQDGDTMRRALLIARGTGRAISNHSQDARLVGPGLMHEGQVSAALGLSAIPASAEIEMVRRDLELARETRGHIHVAHVTTARAVSLIRAAKADGVPVSCEVTPHHLAMTDRWVAGDRDLSWDRPGNGPAAAQAMDTNTKVSPPLRSQEDVLALWNGLRDGTIDAIATDHAPHAKSRKRVAFEDAAVGISNTDTAVSVLLAAVSAGWIDLVTLVERLTIGPSRCFGLSQPSLDGDIVVIDPDLEWDATEDALLSLGKNTPLLGRRLRGRAVYTLVRSAHGIRTWRDPSLDRRHVHEIRP